MPGSSCYLVIGNSIDARGNDALFTDDGSGSVWLYDGQTVRRVARSSFGTAAYW